MRLQIVENSIEPPGVKKGSDGIIIHDNYLKIFTKIKRGRSFARPSLYKSLHYCEGMLVPGWSDRGAGRAPLMKVIEWKPLPSRRRFQIPEGNINSIRSLEDQKMRVEAVSLKKSTLFGLVGVLCMLLGGCGGGGSSGSSGTVAGVQNATPAQTALWAMMLSTEGAGLVQDFIGTSNGGDLSQNIKNYLVNIPCSSGSAKISISGSTVTFSSQNCTITMKGSTGTLNGSGFFAIPTSGSTQCGGSGTYYPNPGTTATISLNNYSMSGKNPTELLAGNGQIVVNAGNSTCSSSSLILPIEVSIPSTSPLTAQVQATSGSVNLNVSVSNLQMDEVVTETTTFFNSTTNPTGPTTTKSGTINSGSFSLNGVTYLFSTSQPLTFNSNNVLSGGTLVVTGPNETETLVFSSSTTGETMVTVTKNGTVVASEPVTTYVGL